MPGLKERAGTLVELLDNASFLFAARPLPTDETASRILDEGGRETLGALSPRLAGVESWTQAALETAVRQFADETGLQARQGRPAAQSRSYRSVDIAGNLRRARRARPGGIACPHRRSGACRKNCLTA